MPPPDGSPLDFGFLWWSCRNPPADPTTSFAGKTILITGANNGLGFESALKFAALGASRLIFGVRSLERGEAAKDDICKRTGYQPDNVVIYKLDMSTFTSVKSFAAAVVAKEPRVDVALLNAGMAAPNHQLSDEGYEMSVQVNGLSTALLGALLLPKLRESATVTGRPACLEINGSTGHGMVREADMQFDEGVSVLDAISKESYFQLTRQYCISKLLNMYIQDGLVEVQERYGGADEVVIVTCCPGLCRSGIARAAPWWQRAADGLFKQLLARSGEEGSRTIVSGTTLGKEAHGQFWAHDMLFR
jgi:NAD(P)-dependent dehydrogenase (short-subunit alcohol dehydrogenase family)